MATNTNTNVIVNNLLTAHKDATSRLSEAKKAEQDAKLAKREAVKLLRSIEKSLKQLGWTVETVEADGPGEDLDGTPKPASEERPPVLPLMIRVGG